MALDQRDRRLGVADLRLRDGDKLRQHRLLVLGRLLRRDDGDGVRHALASPHPDGIGIRADPELPLQGVPALHMHRRARGVLDEPGDAQNC